MQWNAKYVESVFSFANNINTHAGGIHLSGFSAALTRTMNKCASDDGLLKEKDDALEGEDMREGLAAVISVKLRDPQFEGQTKTKLGNPWVRGFVETDRQPEARRVPRGAPAERKRIIRKAIDAARARQAARKAREHPAARARSPAAACRASSPTASPRPRALRALPRRGQLGRRLRESTRATRTTRRSSRCAAR